MVKGELPATTEENSTSVNDSLWMNFTFIAESVLLNVDFKIKLLFSFLFILLVNVSLIAAAWNRYGDSICDMYLNKGSQKDEEPYSAPDNLPREMSYRQ